MINMHSNVTSFQWQW